GGGAEVDDAAATTRQAGDAFGLVVADRAVLYRQGADGRVEDGTASPSCKIPSDDAVQQRQVFLIANTAAANPKGASSAGNGQTPDRNGPLTVVRAVAHEEDAGDAIAANFLLALVEAGDRQIARN